MDSFAIQVEIDRRKEVVKAGNMKSISKSILRAVTVRNIVCP